MSYPWSDASDDAVHLPTLGKMAAANRILRDETLGQRAWQCGLTVGQLDMLERGLIVAPGTITAVLSACGFHRDSFSRKYLGPVLERGLIVAPGTITAVLSACGFHRDSFSRKYLGPVLERQDRCAQSSSRDAQRERLQERVGA